MNVRVLKKNHSEAIMSVLHKGFSSSQVLSRSKVALVISLLVLLLINQVDSTLFQVVVSTLSDAYLGVSVFVALTLGVFYGLDHFFRKDIKRFISHAGSWQIPIASLLGSLPGCGGAIIVVTQFVNGRMSFGALVAVLISTMGDAAFLLLSKKPDIALLVYSISLVSGIIFGFIIDFIHGKDYLRPDQTKSSSNKIEVLRLPSKMVKVFITLLIPGALFGLLEAFQFDSNTLFGNLASIEPVKWLGCCGALLCIVVWFSQPMDSWSARFSKKNSTPYLQETVVAETSFVSVWVVLGFMFYELLIYFSGVNVSAVFNDLGALVILCAILIGFVPGCGPQILITTLYINGVVPLSAQLANAISNDGDALFPAIALAKKAAIIATIYSAIPAFLVGYGLFAFTDL